MGYSVELKAADLRCHSESAARLAAEIVARHPDMCPRRLVVEAACASNPPRDDDWCLSIEHFDGDHWHDDEAQSLWIALSPHLADGSTLELEGGDGERWRIRWEAGRAYEDQVAQVLWTTTKEILSPLKRKHVKALMLHRGGWEATKADLACVPVPESTESYHPVPYRRFIEEVELHVPRFGLTVRSSQFALAREGGQMFGVLTCSNGTPDKDYALAIGVRNSYDRSLAVGLTLGSRVFCCDNLAFSGEVTMHRKHTVNVFRDLPDLIYRMLSQVAAMRERTDDEIAAMKVREMPSVHAHHLMVEAIRCSVLPASRLPKVIEAWEEPAHAEFTPRTAWSLFNAFTEVQKGAPPRAQMEGSLRLSSLFRRELSLN